MRVLAFLVVAGALCGFPSLAAPLDRSMVGWVAARSSHFEVFSQAGATRAKTLLADFEELRSFFDGNRMLPARSEPERRAVVRVIEFRSKSDYDAVKLRTTADAYFTSSGERNYIVMPELGNDEFRVAAHEYAHFVLHSQGLRLPAWLDEGLAELFSTVSITNQRCEFGGPIPARVETLRRRTWLPPRELFGADLDSSLRQTRQGSEIFYAQSWALADMLLASPEYAPRFWELVKMLNSENTSSEQALQRVYGKSPETILADAQDWVAHGCSGRRTVAPAVAERTQVDVSQLSESQASAIMADLLFENGAWNRAERIDQALLQQAPHDPELLAMLGTIALRKGDRPGAVHYWGKAIDRGLYNAGLCYRYAVLVEELQLPPSEVERALERAIAIQPHFDDARFKLALLKNNAGDYSAAVEQLQAMAVPPANRAFSYWTALSYALSEAGKREDAVNAAKQAARFAVTSEQHTQAAQLAYVAKTDLTVQFTRGADGTMQLTTTRVPHGTTEFNPFIEPGDNIQIATGTLRDVECSGGRLTGFQVESKSGVLTLLVPDPTHVLMRHSPAEFSCGPQTSKSVKVEYAASTKPNAGVLRGMDFQ